MLHDASEFLFRVDVGARASVTASDQAGRWDFGPWVDAVKPFCEAPHMAQIAAPGDIGRRLELSSPFVGDGQEVQLSDEVRLTAFSSGAPVT